jgi:pimeloyl-ACP methyl ester carboxylesterase
MRLSLKSLPVAHGQFLYADVGSQDAANVLALVHAFPMGVRMWEPQAAEPPPGWRVILPALAGFDGSTPRPSDTAAMDDYARDVLTLLAALGIERAVIGGVSMGGYVTFGVLRLASERVRGVILADTRSGADSEEARAGRRRMIELLEREGPGGVAADMLPKLLGRTTLATRPELVRFVRATIESQSKEAIEGAILRLMSRPDSTPLLASVRVPALVLVGDEDALTPPSEAEKMHAALPDATLEIIRGAGHLSNLENPDAFNAAVARFLTRLA